MTSTPERSRGADALDWRAGDFARPQGEGVLCTLCPHACALGDGEVGFCKVRRNYRGRLQTATFSTAAQHLTAIERKPLYHYRPGRKVLTLGPPGCSFACRYCQNYRLSQVGRSSASHPMPRPVDVDAAVQQAAHHDAALGLSYAEPSLAPELTVALARAGQRLGVEVIWKTNGFLQPEAARSLAGHLAAANVDLKSVDGPRHRALTGADPGPVLETIEIFRQAGVWVEVSTPLIPEVNNDTASLRAIAQRIAAIDRHIPWHLVRFHPDYKMHRSTPTTNDRLAAGQRVGKEEGLAYVYVERAFGDVGRATHCPGCEELLVRRDIWRLAECRLEGGRCPRCSVDIAGRWSTTQTGPMGRGTPTSTVVPTLGASP